VVVLAAIDKVKVMALLKLSYDHLPVYLKHCFEYCSLFPKKIIFFSYIQMEKKKKLITIKIFFTFNP
jgi:hypothetical protein